MNIDLIVEITEEGADAERIATLSGYLRELPWLDVANVRAPSADRPARSRRSRRGPLGGAGFAAASGRVQGLPHPGAR